jgi:hypothetical protein
MLLPEHRQHCGGSLTIRLEQPMWTGGSLGRKVKFFSRDKQIADVGLLRTFLTRVKTRRRL